jgi:hypothetical protein
MRISLFTIYLIAFGQGSAMEEFVLVFTINCKNFDFEIELNFTICLEFSTQVIPIPKPICMKNHLRGKMIARRNHNGKLVTGLAKEPR